MTNIKPGDKFNIRHEPKGDGQYVWSGPYECYNIIFHTYGDTTIEGFYDIEDGHKVFVDPMQCVKVEDEKEQT